MYSLSVQYLLGASSSVRLCLHLLQTISTQHPLWVPGSEHPGAGQHNQTTVGAAPYHSTGPCWQQHTANIWCVDPRQCVINHARPSTPPPLNSPTGWQPTSAASRLADVMAKYMLIHSHWYAALFDQLINCINAVYS
jgi:hypothetical protein